MNYTIGQQVYIRAGNDAIPCTIISIDTKNQQTTIQVDQKHIKLIKIKFKTLLNETNWNEEKQQLKLGAGWIFDPNEENQNTEIKNALTELCEYTNGQIWTENGNFYIELEEFDEETSTFKTATYQLHITATKVKP